tara:strand:+ start:282 stop:1001 length:720 start_codon:yes stop_codon:yes gene_type:complete
MKRNSCPDGYSMSPNGVCEKSKRSKRIKPRPTISKHRPESNSRSCAGGCYNIWGQNAGCVSYGAGWCGCPQGLPAGNWTDTCYYDAPDPDPNCCNGLLTCESTEFCNDDCECEEHGDNRCCFVRCQTLYDNEGSSLGTVWHRFQWYDPNYNSDPYDFESSYGCTDPVFQNETGFEDWINTCIVMPWGNQYFCGSYSPSIVGVTCTGYSYHSCTDYVPSHTPDNPPPEYRQGGRIKRRRR